MQDHTNPRPTGRAAALARQREIAALYAMLKRSLFKQIKSIGEVDEATPKALITKIGELTAAHLILLKAEEAFREKYAEDDATVNDHDALRDQIGRQLGRIRAARSAGSISEGTE